MKLGYCLLFDLYQGQCTVVWCISLGVAKCLPCTKLVKKIVSGTYNTVINRNTDITVRSKEQCSYCMLHWVCCKSNCWFTLTITCWRKTFFFLAVNRFGRRGILFWMFDAAVQLVRSKGPSMDDIFLKGGKFQLQQKCKSPALSPAPV
jgi:hypothetical protein